MPDISDINFSQWFVQRELDYLPVHFVATKTLANREAMEWIREKLTGRYSLDSGKSFYPGQYYPHFEDPEEAVFYELKWG